MTPDSAQSDGRWSLGLRRVRPGDWDWPWRWRVEVYDKYHWDRFSGEMRTMNVTFTEASARRWARRYIAKIERSESSERMVPVSLDEKSP